MARRLNGEGTIYENKIRKRWECQISCIVNGKKTRKKVTGKTRKEVKEKAELLKMDLANAAEDIMTVGKWLDMWLSIYVRGHVKEKTKERYELAVNNHIVPYIGDKDVRKITSLEIQEFINILYESGGENGTGLSPRTVNSSRTILKTALKQAVGAGVIDKNPAVFTKPIKVERSEIQVLTQLECQRLVQTAYKESNKAFWIAVVIAVETGLRKGEVFGLRWRDIDFDKKCISVDTTIVTGNHGMKIQNSTKTKGSRRTIDITDTLIAKLQEYKVWQERYLSAIGAIDKYDGFLITSEVGTVKDPNNFTYVAFKRMLKNAGLSNGIRFHDLRHTHASQLLQAGVDVKSVSERLGHSSIRITLDTYAHVLPSMKDSVINKLNDLSLTGA